MIGISFQALCDAEPKISDVLKIAEMARSLPENRNLHYDPKHNLILEFKNKSAEEILWECWNEKNKK